MSLEILLVVISLGTAFLFYKLSKTSRQIQQQQREYEALKHKYHTLQNTLMTRGQRLDVLLSAISEVVLRVDKQGRVLGGNKQAHTLFQLDTLPALPQSLLLLYRDSEWMHDFYQAIEALPEQKKLPEMHVNGRILSPKLAALNDDEALLLCLDVTAYTQLQRKQKSLLENLMHDLKTPLTSLLGYARSIESFGDDKALREEAVAVIAHEAKHINALVNGMLTLNQIEQASEQSMAEERNTCDMKLELERVWQSLDEKIQGKSITLKTTMESATMMVNMSETDCYRILLNVADNAVKFSPPKAEILCEVKELNEGFFQVSIQDQGHGIAESKLHRVTERFYREDKVRGREKEEGHGLGLAIVQETLSRDGGSLHIQNVDEGGLKVDINIPKAAAP